MTDQEQFPVVSSEVVYTGRVVELRKDVLLMPDGTQAVREIVGHPGAVGVVAVDADECIVLVNQYRHAVGRRLDELPAGLLDVSGESPLAGAKRELAEEARLQADSWHTLVDLHLSPGFSAEVIRIYLARGLQGAVLDDFVAEHEEESMTVEWVSLDAALARVQQGQITNAAAVAGILAAVASRATGWSGLRSADEPWLVRPGAR
jgi:8-oxo-dGTP pyrophosphatase MutT (NUDIX family)